MTFPIFNLPRVVIILIDLCIVLFSSVLAYLLRFNFHIPANELATFPYVVGYILLTRGISFTIARTYAGIIRYTSTRDAIRIFITILSGSIFFSITNIITFYFINNQFFIPFSIIIIEFLASIFTMILFRLVIKMAYLEIINPSKEKSNIIIFGAGEAGIIAKHALDRDAGSKFKVVAFIDDDPKKAGKKLEGITIHDASRLSALLEQYDVFQVILSVQNLNPARKKEVIELCLQYNVKVLNVPPVSHWINGELSFNQIRSINIDDLLDREEIRLDTRMISNELLGRKILVTGACGSIGSELARQILKYQPKQMILVDQAETPLYHQELELNEPVRKNLVEVVVADICNKERMQEIFSHYQPEVVYHAAAYKHVPMMENNPQEAILTNVYGTKALADLSIGFHVQKFIMISTDKAVNPSSVMGVTKRIAEIYVQTHDQLNKTRFITTRFGNVIGSNGSVIPLFKKQLEKGGPITITHPEITRYFMTIPEACQLVLEAGAMGKGGEIYIFNMGKSIKIADLAKKMIRLYGLELGRDIQIVYTGLRPGEKLYEELLANEENTLPTHHPVILIAKVRGYDLESVKKEVDELVRMATNQDVMALIGKMKAFVPEFKSTNSAYGVMSDE